MAIHQAANAYVVVFKKVTRREFVYEAVTLPIYRHSFFGD